MVSIDSFEFLISSLDSLVKNLSIVGFKYLSQEIDNNLLDLVKQKWFYPYKYMSDFKKFKEQLPTKNNCIVPLLGKNSDKHHAWTCS